MGQSTRGHARYLVSETIRQSDHGESSEDQTNDQGTVRQCDQRARKEERTAGRTNEIALAASRHE